jgi:DNA primase
MPFIDYQAVRSRIGMEEVLEQIGFLATTRKGPKLRGPCPLPHCRSQSPRTFSVHLAKKLYHCFTCKNQGNHLDLWAAVQQLTIYQAAIDLCKKANIPIPQHPAANKTPTSPAPANVSPGNPPDGPQ